jgi:DNA-binding NarL/FixJ family response regulator
MVALIQEAEGFACVGSFADGESALARIPSINPDIALMDIGLPGMSGIECAHALSVASPELPIVMLTVYDEGDYLFDALRAGASGYLLKRTPAPRLFQALREACQGGLPLSRQMATRVQDYFQEQRRSRTEISSLSPREQETLRHLAEGLRYKEIADALGISLDTVRQYVRGIYSKMHVSSRTEAVVKYLRR